MPALMYHTLILTSLSRTQILTNTELMSLLQLKNEEHGGTWAGTKERGPTESADVRSKRGGSARSGGRWGGREASIDTRS